MEKINGNPSRRRRKKILKERVKDNTFARAPTEYQSQKPKYEESWLLLLLRRKTDRQTVVFRIDDSEIGTETEYATYETVEIEQKKKKTERDMVMGAMGGEKLM